jgi:RecQ family ATP-dependent DNA helicase
MQDQTQKLQHLGIQATYLGTAQQDPTCWQRVEAGEYSVVYMSPEFATMKWPAVVGLRDRLAVFAVDEAHCVSSWGHDFRPEFRRIAELMADIPEVPRLALTATCTMRVQHDLCELLGISTTNSGAILRDANVIPRNLRLVVADRRSKEHDLTELLELACPQQQGLQEVERRRRHPVDNSYITPYSSTLIYVPTKVMADELSAWLCLRGVRSDSYHAGLSVDDRLKAHSRFFEGDLQILCCTVAYGMGISKPDIRRIIHYGAPFTLENYVQQVGRAGRDGDLAECICFASEKDEWRNRQILLRGAQMNGAPDFYVEELMRMTTHLTSFLRSSNCRLVSATRYFNVGSQENLMNLLNRAVCVTGATT